MKQRSRSCRRGSVSWSRPMRRWEKLSGSCTPGTSKSPTPPRRRAIRRIPDAENELVAELTRAIGSQRQALAMIDLSRSTWHYRSSRGHRSMIRYRRRTGATPRASASPTGGNRGADHRRLAGRAFGRSRVRLQLGCRGDAGRAAVLVAYRGHIADQCAVRSLHAAPEHAAPRPAPVLKATGPGQVWSWDITDLCTPWRGSRSRRTRSSTSSPA